MIDLYGYKYSVYAWIARFTLHEKGINYNWIEVNPFSGNVDPAYLRKHPFCRVPTLVHGNFVLYETGAITRYVDEAFEGPKLQPDGLKERARANQVMSIVDSYTYWPFVRQVFVHGVMGPRPAERSILRRSSADLKPPSARSTRSRSSLVTTSSLLVHLFRSPTSILLQCCRISVNRMPAKAQLIAGGG